MEKGKIFDFIRKRGTLGVLTLALVGIVAFASYRTSYPVTTETEEQKESTQTSQTETVDSAKNASLATVDQIDDGKKDAAQIANTTSVQAQIADGGEHTVGTDSTQENETEADGRHTREVSTESDAMTEDTQEVLSGSVISPTVQFTEDSSLSWPAAGSILMDYSMDGTVYFQTLNEYKYNPALIIGSQTGNPVVAAAKGIVESIDINEETGTTLTMNIGDNYELIYGQLKEVAVAQGDVVEQGELLGYVSEPTKYYCEEGSNLYFAMKKDGQVTDPCLYLE
ncbi:MAG: M23 family metallopeptidase [Lachnospiraceae bacterium]